MKVTFEQRNKSKNKQHSTAPRQQEILSTKQKKYRNKNNPNQVMSPRMRDFDILLEHVYSRTTE